MKLYPYFVGGVDGIANVPPAEHVDVEYVVPSSFSQFTFIVSARVICEKHIPNAQIKNPIRFIFFFSFLLATRSFMRRVVGLF